MSNMSKECIISLQAALTAAGAWISAKLGILLPMLGIFAACMLIDCITGYLASAREALLHPEDEAYGWSSKKGRLGIYKKVGYICVVAVCMLIDCLIKTAGDYLGYSGQAMALFGLLAICWYILNECLSIVENAGRMGAPVPQWLARYIAILKNKIDKEAEKEAEKESEEQGEE